MHVCSFETCEPGATRLFLFFLIAVLPELPLPSAIPQASSRSLLFHPKIAEEARNILATRDDKLVSQLVHALRLTNTDYM